MKRSVTARRRLSTLRAAVVAVGLLGAAAAMPAYAAEPRKAAVILVNFAPTAAEPFTADQARTAVFTGTGSVNVFQREHSGDVVSLTGKLRSDGDVFGWYTIDESTAVCDPDTWRYAANAAAQTAGADLSGYQHHLYIFPYVSACGWAGLADLPGSVSFMNGTLSVRVIAHELGHNLGAHHASALNCTDVATGNRVAFSTSCTQSEYGDPFDVMGASDRQSEAIRKVSLGWLTPQNAQTVTASGTYTLSSASAFGAGTRSLRIPRGASSDYWYLELRSPSGLFDDFTATDPAVTGVSVRLAGNYGIGVRTRLIDTQPATATFADAPLQPGATFTDPVTGIAITATSVVAGVATMQVALEPSAPPAAPAPAPTPPPAWTVEPGPTTTTPPISAMATVTLRRTSVRAAILRLGAPAMGGAARCAVHIGGARWTRCTISAGRIALARPVVLRAGRVPVALRLDGTVVVAAYLQVPRIGGVTKLTRPLRVV